MSSQEITSNTGKQLFVNTDTAQVFIGGNHTRQDAYINNSGYAPITLYAGTVMGRIAQTGVVAPFNAYANDGTQYVVGLLADDLILAAGSSSTVSLVVAGRVNQDKVAFFPTSSGITLESVVSGRRVKDKIMSETTGLLLVKTIEMSGYDNS